jgi:predicted branched-subunit amino acid permease
MELMNKHAASAVVIVTGLVINLRFLLYSAAISPIVQRTRFSTKLLTAYWLTDQSYAAMSAHQSKLHTNADAVRFYLGAALCMALSWHLSVLAGYIFGNFAPPSMALDYAVPISFVALLIPTLKNKKYLVVAAFSFVVALLLNNLPYRIGLIATALLSVILATILTKKKAA